ncbi:MAG: hypothetical protein ABIG28_00460 [archaeon]
MTRKSFFKERTPVQIRKLRISRVPTQRNLIEKIVGLDPREEALEIRTCLIPGRFLQYTNNWAQASRKALKHGPKLRLPHPTTWSACKNSPHIPLAYRVRAFKTLEEMKEQDIHFSGYDIKPTWGDQTRRVFPFVWASEGIRLFAYAENNAGGIKVEDYADARKVARNGGSFVVEVPSRTPKSSRYKFRLDHVPVIRDPRNLAAVLTLKPAVITDGETGEPKVGRTPHETYLIQYGYEDSPGRDDPMTMYPQDLAAYLTIARNQWRQHNMTTMEMNPFVLISREGAEFCNRLNNNVLVYDPSLIGKQKTRKLHIYEKSVLIARAIGHFSHDEFAFWDWDRDGRPQDYDWSIPK